MCWHLWWSKEHVRVAATPSARDVAMSIGSMSKSQSATSLASLQAILQLQKLYKAEKAADSISFSAELLGIENELHIFKRSTEVLLAELRAKENILRLTPTSVARRQQNQYDQQKYSNILSRIEHHLEAIDIWRSHLDTVVIQQRRVST